MKTKHSIKRIAKLSGVVGLLLVAALVAVLPTLATQKLFSQYNLNGSATLTAVGGDEPNASGTAKLNCQVTPGPFGASGKGHQSVSCQGLTPNASYEVGEIGGGVDGIADGNGALKISSSFSFGSKSGGGGFMPGGISVYRVESSGNVLVLSGTFTWQ